MLRLTLALISGLTACTVLAADFQTVDSIKAAALGALPAGSEAEATLDSALRLPRCDASLVPRGPRPGMDQRRRRRRCATRRGFRE